MSKLIEKLKKLAQAAPPPMGFHTSRAAAAAAPLLLIGRVTLDGTTPQVKSGADAWLFYTEKPETDIESVRRAAKAAGETPWGVYLEESGSVAGEIIGAGCDFGVFSPAAPVTDLPPEDKAGRVLQVESSMDDGLLRAINELPVDAVIIGDVTVDKEPLPWHQIMIYRHLADFISKPLLVPVRPDITEAELKALLAAEIDGVITYASGETLKELHELIAKLPPRAAKKRETGNVIVPRLGVSAEAPEPDEDDE